MVIVLICAVVLAWCLLPLPLAVACGRAFAAGSQPVLGLAEPEPPTLAPAV